MLGRYGEAGHSPQPLLDRRQLVFVVTSINALFAGLLLEYVFHVEHPYLINALYAVGVALLGGPIVINAVRGLIGGHTNVDELVALALIASCIGGYFLEASIVATLMVLGSLFEQRASLRARRAIEQLLKLTPHEALRLQDDGREEVVPVEELRINDRVLVRTGSTVPADGTIERGSANFDQSAITGESVPVFRQAGGQIFAGTLALDGAVVARVDKTGEDSTVGQIIRIVQDAEHYQAPAMRIADRWARWYTPLILIIAAGAWIGSVILGSDLTWQRAVAVLIVGCPCALVLATPTAIIAAMGRAAKLGVLIKSGAVLERASEVDTLIFDKTGTLTCGKHEVVAAVPANDLKGLEDVRGLCPALTHSILRLQSDDDAPAALRNNEPSTIAARHHLLALAAAVEHHSSHPFARAIRQHAKDNGVAYVAADDVREIPGIGVQGRVNGQKVVVGRPQFIAESIRNACAVPGTLIRPIQRYSVIAVEVAGTYAGLLLLQDSLRETSQRVLIELREAGLKNLSVLSGDNPGAVRLVADKLRLDHAYAGLLPADKAKQVGELQSAGHVVAFVGDGMNDAPALARADVGIAMGGSGTDLALETADIVLLNDRIELLATLFALARRVKQTIHINLVLGLTLNVAALVLASAGVLSPMLGALVHNLGSVFVVSNSARFAAFGKVSKGRGVVIDPEAPAPSRKAA